METSRRSFLAAAVGAAALGAAAPALANKSAATVEAPATAGVGDEITIKVHVKHLGNSLTHYTEWVYIKVNGEEAKRWEFSSLSRPEDQDFTREIKFKVTGPLQIEGESHFNIHGSAGISLAKVEVK